MTKTLIIDEIRIDKKNVIITLKGEEDSNGWSRGDWSYASITYPLSCMGDFRVGQRMTVEVNPAPDAVLVISENIGQLAQ